MTSLSLHSVFLSRKAELDQFFSDLGPIKKLISDHPEKTKPLLLSGYSKPLAAGDVMSLVEFEDVDDIHKEFFNHYVLTEGAINTVGYFIISTCNLVLHC
jgi:hypothetical protein